MKEVKKRMVGPDVMKIAATFFVIYIHHKTRNDSEFHLQYDVMLLGMLLVAAAISVGIYLYGRKKQWTPKQLHWATGAPLLFLLSIPLLSKYAVSFFLIISGFMLTISMEKAKHPIKEWYRPSNLIPRVLRFYLTLMPIVIVGLLIHIFLQDKAYDTVGVLKRIFLGGFAPGSYYVVVMAQFMLLFPLLYLIVKEWQGKGIVLILLVTLAWDIIATGWLQIPDKAYKFCILRLLPQFAFGIYAKLNEHRKRPLLHGGMFLAGLVYVLVFVVFRMVPLPIFYQWRSSSLVIAVFLYPIIVWLLSAFQKVSYTDSGLSNKMITLSNATYHIFLVQMLYYNMIGYAWNEQVDNIALTMPVNLLICFTGGLLYYRWFSPVENRLMKGLKTRLTPKNKRSRRMGYSTK